MGDRRGDAVVARPSPVLVATGGVVAVLTGAAAVAVATGGSPLLGITALVATGLLASVAAVAAGARSSADADGVEVRWLRRTVAVRWDAIARIEVVTLGSGRVVGGAVVVGRAGATMRWVPWFPFLWFAHGAVRRGVEGLRLLASAHGVPVVDVDGRN